MKTIAIVVSIAVASGLGLWAGARRGFDRGYQNGFDRGYESGCTNGASYATEDDEALAKCIETEQG